jgi:hypothetical protein
LTTGREISTRHGLVIGFVGLPLNLAYPRFHEADGLSPVIEDLEPVGAPEGWREPNNAQSVATQDFDDARPESAGERSPQ